VLTEKTNCETAIKVGFFFPQNKNIAEWYKAILTLIYIQVALMPGPNSALPV